MDLKYWSDSPKVWFLHMTDHVTWHCVLCVVRSEKKEAILEKFFKLFLLAKKPLANKGTSL